jgi:hypothetical protein
MDNAGTGDAWVPTHGAVYPGKLIVASVNFPAFYGTKSSCEVLDYQRMVDNGGHLLMIIIIKVIC